MSAWDIYEMFYDDPLSYIVTLFGLMFSDHLFDFILSLFFSIKNYYIVIMQLSVFNDASFFALFQHKVTDSIPND